MPKLSTARQDRSKVIAAAFRILTVSRTTLEHDRARTLFQCSGCGGVIIESVTCKRVTLSSPISSRLIFARPMTEPADRDDPKRNGTNSERAGRYSAHGLR